MNLLVGGDGTAESVGTYEEGGIDKAKGSEMDVGTAPEVFSRMYKEEEVKEGKLCNSVMIRSAIKVE